MKGSDNWIFVVTAIIILVAMTFLCFNPGSYDPVVLKHWSVPL
jgi:hypothetical protein